MLRIEDVAVGQPGAGEAKLRVESVGLNRAESMYYHGQYFEKPELPSGVGYEVYGEVTAVGPDVDPGLVGKKFATWPGYSMNKYPSLAEEAIVPAQWLAAVPPQLSPVEAAAVWMQYGTAYGPLIEFGKVGPGDFVILPAASSSVGLAAIELVKAAGAVSIAATRTSDKKARLLELGADHVIATQEEDLPARVREITGGKLSRVVFDPVGGDYVSTLAQATADEGTIYLYGMLSGQPTMYPLVGFSRGVAVRGASIHQMTKPERFERVKQDIYDRLAAGKLKPVIAKTFPFAESVEAYRYLESNQQIGKVVITV